MAGNNEVKSSKIVMLVATLLFYIAALILALVWFGWKLAVVFILFQISNNFGTKLAEVIND